jgi:hypothetical protein
MATAASLPPERSTSAGHRAVPRLMCGRRLTQEPLATLKTHMHLRTEPTAVVADPIRLVLADPATRAVTSTDIARLT